MKLLTVCGTNDKIYTITMMEKQNKTLVEKGFEVESIYHPGKHNLEKGALMKVRDILTS
jgi:predicted esterase